MFYVGLYILVIYILTLSVVSLGTESHEEEEGGQPSAHIDDLAKKRNSFFYPLLRRRTHKTITQQAAERAESHINSLGIQRIKYLYINEINFLSAFATIGLHQ